MYTAGCISPQIAEVESILVIIFDVGLSWISHKTKKLLKRITYFTQTILLVRASYSRCTFPQCLTPSEEVRPRIQIVYHDVLLSSLRQDMFTDLLAN